MGRLQPAWAATAVSHPLINQPTRVLVLMPFGPELLNRRDAGSGRQRADAVTAAVRTPAISVGSACGSSTARKGLAARQPQRERRLYLAGGRADDGEQR